MWFWSLYLLCELHRDENNSRIKKKDFFFLLMMKTAKQQKQKQKTNKINRTDFIKAAPIPLTNRKTKAITTGK